MSDSEDDKPLAIRAAPALKAPVNGHPAGVLVDDPARRKAAQKAPIIESDSEDDKPLGARAKPVAVKAAARPRSAETAAIRKQNQQAAAKPVAVKDDPLSPPAVKQEPRTSANKKQPGKDTKGGAEGKKKRVIVKKEYDMPGQTKDTPLAIEPLFKFYTSLREQKPASDMAKKWCLVHGLLEREEAEEYVDEIKRKKGDLRSPGKATDGTAGARKRAAAGAARPPASKPASSKPPARPKVKIESDSEDGEEDFLPQRKRPKPSGSKQGSADPQAAAPKPRPTSGASRASSASGDRSAPKPKPRPATQKDKAFADGGLDPISDDSDDDVPLGRRMVKPSQT